MPIPALFADLATVLGDEPPRREIFDRITELHGKKPDGYLFAIAKLVYAVLFQPKILHAIDFRGMSTAMRLDLNQPIALLRRTDLSEQKKAWQEAR